MTRNLKFVKLLFLVAVLSSAACKNDKKSDAESDLKENAVENVDEKELSLEHVPAVLLTMHKVTMTFAEIGAEKSKNSDVQKFIEVLRNELGGVVEKSEYIFRENDLVLKESQLSRSLSERFKRTEEELMNADSEKFDQIYLKNMVDYLFAQLRIVETELAPFREDRKLGDVMQLTMITYKTQADRALNLLKKIEG